MTNNSRLQNTHCVLLLLLSIIFVGGCSSRVQPPIQGIPTAVHISTTPQIRQIVWNRAGDCAFVTRSDLFGGYVTIQTADGTHRSFGSNIWDIQWSPDGKCLLYQNCQRPDISEASNLYFYNAVTQQVIKLTSGTGRISVVKWYGNDNVIFATIPSSPGNPVSVSLGNVNGKVSSQFDFPQRTYPSDLVVSEGSIYSSISVFKGRTLERWIYKCNGHVFYPLVGTDGTGSSLIAGPKLSDITFSISSREGRLASIRSLDTSVTQPQVRTILPKSALPNGISLSFFDFSSDGQTLLIDAEDHRGNEVVYLCDITRQSWHEVLQSKVATFTSTPGEISYTGPSTLGGGDDSIYVSDFDGSHERKIYGPLTLWGLGIIPWIIITALCALSGLSFVLIQRRRTRRLLK